MFKLTRKLTTEYSDWYFRYFCPQCSKDRHYLNDGLCPHCGEISTYTRKGSQRTVKEYTVLYWKIIYLGTFLNKSYIQYKQGTNDEN